MPVLYKPFQSNLEDKKSGKKLFYPHVVRTGNINSAQLSKEIAAYSSLSPGDVKNTLDNLVTVMAQHLQSSESVSVDGLGTFRMVMSARGRGVELRLPSASSLPRRRIWTVPPLPVLW
jgi:predicted histone-like DNA-binding protein